MQELAIFVCLHDCISTTCFYNKPDIIIIIQLGGAAEARDWLMRVLQLDRMYKMITEIRDASVKLLIKTVV